MRLQPMPSLNDLPQVNRDAEVQVQGAIAFHPPSQQVDARARNRHDCCLREDSGACWHIRYIVKNQRAKLKCNLTTAAREEAGPYTPYMSYVYVHMSLM